MKKKLIKLLEIIKGYEVQFITLLMFLLFINLGITSLIEFVNVFFKGIAHVLVESIKAIKNG